MRFQQNVAELVIKGDSTLEHIFPPKDEQPEWATFDEDLPDDERRRRPRPTSERRTEGRFALYTSADGATGPSDSWARSAATAGQAVGVCARGGRGA